HAVDPLAADRHRIESQPRNVLEVERRPGLSDHDVSQRHVLQWRRNRSPDLEHPVHPVDTEILEDDVPVGARHGAIRLVTAYELEPDQALELADREVPHADVLHDTAAVHAGLEAHGGSAAAKHVVLEEDEAYPAGHFAAER